MFVKPKPRPKPTLTIGWYKTASEINHLPNKNADKMSIKMNQMTQSDDIPKMPQTNFDGMTFADGIC